MVSMQNFTNIISKTGSRVAVPVPLLMQFCVKFYVFI